MTTTNLFVPLRAHMLSAAVGSGKTRAAVAWIADPKNAARNVLYVAPTTALIDQTGKAVREAIAQAEGPTVRNVNLVHSGTAESGQVRAEALQGINAADEGEGLVQLVTTTSFLAIVSKIKNPERWAVILDEAFNPASFESFRLGADALTGWEHFRELFAVDATQGHRIVPREGKRKVVEEVAQGDYATAGDRFKSLEAVAKAVANPAIRCELVLTDGAEALLQGEAPKRRKATKDGTGTVLQFASYVDPLAFSGFREVLFLSALFEQTILYHLWTKALGVTFEEHPEFPAHLLRDTHREQGRFLAVGHLLHKDDPASMENLTRETLTGKPGATRPGTRVIDHLVQTAAAHFGSDEFLLQSNARYGYIKDAACVPRNAVVIPTASHGLNSFQGVDNVAALAVTNPNPQQLAWIKSRTGMTSRAVTQAFRIHATYQALGRCSIRRAEPTSSAKVVLVVGAEDARFIRDLFPGSHWLGQVGTLPSLAGLRLREETKEPGKAETLAKTIVSHLNEVPEGTNKVTSRGLKAAVESDQQHLMSLGAEGQIGVAAQTWKRALSLSCVLSGGWQKQGHNLHRLTAEHYGFQCSPEAL
jgi:hypothetical protein